MVEQDRYCIDVLTQISAIQAALDKVGAGAARRSRPDLRARCEPEDQTERTAELMAAVGRLMRRG